VIIAGAGGAAHLPGMTAALTPLPVFGVPVSRRRCQARTACCRSCRCRPASPSARWPSAKAGAVNAALLAAAVLALGDDRHSPSGSTSGARADGRRGRKARTDDA
jgi:5-(carboxyamino)imidazole ribonucleotide mutase